MDQTASFSMTTVFPLSEDKVERQRNILNRHTHAHTKQSFKQPDVRVIDSKFKTHINTWPTSRWYTFSMLERQEHL